MDDERPIRPMPTKTVKEVKKCQAVIKKGRRKGEVCGNMVRVGEFCGTHSKDKSKYDKSYFVYVKKHWNESEGDDFGEKIRDLARSWNDGGKEDGLYHSDGSIHDY